jgi:NAD(P) transhydrogenase subunit beta
MNQTLLEIVFLVASVGFILTLHNLSSIQTARVGNMWGMLSMALSVGGLFLLVLPASSYLRLTLGIAMASGIGAWIALRTPMMALPQLMAAFHSLVGLAAVCVAGAALLAPDLFGLSLQSAGQVLEMGLGAAVGGVTFTGSLVAFLKLQGGPLLKTLEPLGQRALLLRNVSALVWGIFFLIFLAVPTGLTFLLMTLLSLGMGLFLVLPIGGADMPVVVSMLNSYSGWAACGIGFTLSNSLLIIVGALVGASGAILSYIMCQGMNRSFLKVILGGGSGPSLSADPSSQEVKPFKKGSPEEAAFFLAHAQQVVVIPGYGMAVAQAQHALKEMVDVLRQAGVSVRFAIHPVAGRMPGHMNVLLAEAGVAYDDVLELEDINSDFPQTDVAFVIGANDITNPSAKTDPQSPLFGMPVLDVERAKTTLFIKRSMGSGYAGVDNPLFYQDSTFMLLGDAKHVCEAVTKSLRQN